MKLSNFVIMGLRPCLLARLFYVWSMRVYIPLPLPIMNTIKLQNATPRPQSLAYQLSCSAWQDGIYSFYRNAVPFSYTTGHEYAHQLVQLFIEICRTCPLDTYHIYELGAGTGLLSKHFLDILQKSSPDLYTKTIVHITDDSTQLISELQTQLFF